MWGEFSNHFFQILFSHSITRSFLFTPPSLSLSLSRLLALSSWKRALSASAASSDSPFFANLSLSFFSFGSTATIPNSSYTMVRRVQKIRNAVQSVLYKLGPTYCILLGSLFLFFSFVIQLLTSVGVPYIKSFDFLRFDLENFTFVELGMWAACTGREAITFPTRPDLNEPEAFTCPPASWGWKTLRYSGITNNFFDKNLPKAVSWHSKLKWLILLQKILI